MLRLFILLILLIYVRAWPYSHWLLRFSFPFGLLVTNYMNNLPILKVPGESLSVLILLEVV